MHQTSLLKQLGYSHEATHGGGSTKDRRKVRRPLDPRKPVHLILRASKATGKLSMLRDENRTPIYQLVYRKADKFGVRLECFANVGNHLHFKIKFRRRENFQRYLKSISALIARHVTGARKGKPFGKFWDFLAYTKVIKVWTQERWLDHYITANNVEADHGQEWRERYLAKHRGAARDTS